MATTYSSNTYVAEEHVKPNDVGAFVHIWNSAASITNPVSRLYHHRVDVTSAKMSGADAASGNVQTSKTVAFSPEDGGETFILEWRADIEGRTINKWLLIVCDALPR